MDQLSFIDDVFTEWPYDSTQGEKITEIAKRDVIKNMGKEIYDES